MKAIIFVRGGVAEVITDDPRVHVRIIDYDVEGDDAPDVDAEGDPCHIVEEHECNEEIVEQYWPED